MRASDGSRAPEPFAAEVMDGRLILSGRLDGRTAAELHEAVSALLRTAQLSWTLDVGLLIVGDDAGLRALVGCYQRALRHDRAVILHGAAPALRHALGRLRLDVHLLAPDDPAATGSGPVAERGPVTT